MQISSLGGWLGSAPTFSIDNSISIGSGGAMQVPMTTVDGVQGLITVSGNCEMDTSFEFQAPGATDFTEASTLSQAGSEFSCANKKFKIILDANFVGVTPAAAQSSPGDIVRAFQMRVKTRTTKADKTTNTLVNDYALEALHTAPAVEIRAPVLVSLTNRSAYSFNGTCSASGGRVTVSGDLPTPTNLDTSCAAGTWSLTGLNLTGVTDAAHPLNVLHYDSFGAFRSTSGNYTADTTPPVVSITGTLALINNLNASAYPVSGSCESGLTVGIEIATITQTLACANGSFSGYLMLSALSDGTYNLHVTQADLAGNSSTASQVVTRASSVPLLTLTSNSTNPVSAAGTTNGLSVNLNLSVTGTTASQMYISNTSCSVGGSWEAFSAMKSWSLAAGADGTRSVYGKVKNSDGNESVCVATSLVYDSIGPVTAISATTMSGVTNSANASSTFSATDGGTGISQYECSMDGGAFTVCTSGYNYNVSEGARTFQVRAVDRAGNAGSALTRTWTVDTTAPNAPTISSFPVAVTANTFANFVFTSSGDNGGGSGLAANYVCKLDGSTYPCVSPQNPTALAEGAHSFSVQAKDNAGNLSAASTAIAWAIDLTGPVTVINSASADYTNSTVNFSFSGTDTGGSTLASYLCAVDAGSFSTCTSPFTTSAAVAEGLHTFKVKAVDGVGNGGGVASRDWTLDKTAPSVSIISGPPSTVTTSSVTFQFDGADIGGTGVVAYECTLNSVATTCASPKVYSSLTTGAYTFSVKAIDMAGNKTVTAASSSFNVSLVGITSSIDSAPPAYSNDNTPTFVFSTVGGTTFECSIDGGATYSTCTSPKTYGPLADGSYTFKVRSYVVVMSPGPAETYSWTIDTVAPSLTINSYPAVLSTNKNPQFTFTGTDAVQMGNLECSSDGGATYATCASPKNFSNLVDDTYSLAVRAVDAAGNRSAAQTKVWTVDTTGPVTTISSNPATATNLSTANFSFSAVDASASVASYQCSWNNGAFSPCTSPTSQSVAEGARTFSVKAIDSLGNVGSPASYNWTLDFTAPTVTITSGPSSVVSSTATSFYFTATDALGISSFECAIDSGTFVTCTSPKSFTAAAGSHNFKVRAVDLVGNTSSAVTQSWTVDTTGPTTSITSAPGAFTNILTASFGFSAVDTGGSTVASYQCSLDGAAFTTCTSLKNYSSLSTGAHTFQVQATDAVGNTGAAVSTAWTIDTVAPVVSVTSAPSGTVNSAAAAFAFSMSDVGGSGLDYFQCAMDAGAFATCNSIMNYSGLAEGSHTFKVKAFDKAANESPTVTRTWSIDTVVPTVSMGLSQNYHDGSSPVTVSFAFSETVSDFDVTDVKFTGTGSLSGFSGGGANYSVVFNPGGANATTTVRIDAGTVSDGAGNSVALISKNIIYSAPPSLSASGIPTGNSSAAVFQASLTLTNATQYLAKWGTSASVSCASGSNYVAYTPTGGMTGDFDFSTIATYPLGSSLTVCLKAYNSTTGQTSSASTYSYTLTDPCTLNELVKVYNTPNSYSPLTTSTFTPGWSSNISKRYVCTKTYGAAGGGAAYYNNSTWYGITGGSGGYVIQRVLLSLTDTFAIYVGRGGLGTPNNPDSVAGSWNGGAGQGGEYSRILFGPSRSNSKLAVAGGGGGGFISYYNGNAPYVAGGSGGNITGVSGYTCNFNRGADAWTLGNTYVQSGGYVNAIGDTTYLGGTGYWITNAHPELKSIGTLGGGGSGCREGAAGNASGMTAASGGSNFAFDSSASYGISSTGVIDTTGDSTNSAVKCTTANSMGAAGSAGGNGCVLIRY